jgi:hypothetical protein
MQLKIFKRILVAMAIIAVIVHGGRMLQANVVYVDVFGDNVAFTSIYETSTATGPFYGQPVAMGNTAVSPGTGFMTQSVNNAIELIDGRLQMTISANPGFQFSSISVRELGSFLGFGATAAVLASANAMVVSSDGSFSDNFFFSYFGNGSGGWDEAFTINFPATTSVTFTLDHQLLSAAGPGAGAFIDTSSIQISVGAFAASVPEPSMLAFLVMIALTLVPMRWRRA